MVVSRKQIVKYAIEHKQTQVCPYTLNMEESVATCLDNFYKNKTWRDQIKNYLVSCCSLDVGMSSNDHICKDIYGSVWKTDGRPFHLETPVLNKPSLKGFHFPNPEKFFADKWESESLSHIAQNADRFTFAAMPFAIFERSWALRGFENVLLDSVAEPAFFEDLMHGICEHQLKLLDRLLALPVDGVLIGDDWGDQNGVIIGPERWREFIKPNVAQLYAKIKSAQKYVLAHCCGSVIDILPDMIEIGLNVFESVQPEARGMNPYQLKQQFGNKLCFWGCLGSQSIIPFGSVNALREEIVNLSTKMAQNGGYILSPAKTLQLDTPVSNAATVIEEFIRVGEFSE